MSINHQMNAEEMEKIQNGLEGFQGSVREMNISKGFIGIISIVLAALVICVSLTLLKDFEKGTSTHCNVDNYLPSISCSIGDFMPQKYIWQVSIAIHTTPRFFYTHTSKNYFISFTEGMKGFGRMALVRAMVVVEGLEILGLLLLTLISSSEAYNWHEKCFVTFVICSQANMLFKIVLLALLQDDPVFCNTMKRSLRLKMKLWALNLFGIVLGGYFFFRHNSYCEPGVYSLFAVCEYIVVLSNIAYHSSSLYEFSSVKAFLQIRSTDSKNKPT